MNTTQSPQTMAQEDLAFTECTAKLERALLAPLVPGDLMNWSKNVQQTAQEVGACLQQYVPGYLHQQYREIAKADPDLLRRVEQMKEEDSTLLTEFKAFEARTRELVALSEPAQNNERKADGLRAELEKQGTGLILAFKKHQVAVDTWRNESLVRDTGTAD